MSMWQRRKWKLSRSFDFICSSLTMVRFIPWDTAALPFFSSQSYIYTSKLQRAAHNIMEIKMQSLLSGLAAECLKFKHACRCLCKVPGKLSAATVTTCNASPDGMAFNAECVLVKCLSTGPTAEESRDGGASNGLRCSCWWSIKEESRHLLKRSLMSVASETAGGWQRAYCSSNTKIRRVALRAAAHQQHAQACKMPGINELMRN